jgi:hypothetical protein
MNPCTTYTYTVVCTVLRTSYLTVPLGVVFHITSSIHQPHLGPCVPRSSLRCVRGDSSYSTVSALCEHNLLVLTPTSHPSTPILHWRIGHTRPDFTRRKKNLPKSSTISAREVPSTVQRWHGQKAIPRLIAIAPSFPRFWLFLSLVHETCWRPTYTPHRLPVSEASDRGIQCNDAARAIPFFSREESVMMHPVPAVSGYPAGAPTILGDSVDISSPSW